MKGLSKILAVGFVIFLAMAMVEEREAFAPLFGSAPTGASAALSEADRRAAVDTVRELLTFMIHLNSTGGDPRFAERLPASPEVAEEILGEAAYVRRNGRFQDLKLMKLEVLEAGSLGGGRLRLLTREFWIVQPFWIHGGKPAGPPSSTVARVEYLLARDAGRWQVTGWEHVPEAPREGKE